ARQGRPQASYRRTITASESSARLIASTITWRVSTSSSDRDVPSARFVRTTYSGAFEILRRLDHAGFAEVTGMGHQRVRELVQALVGVRVGMRWRAKQREPHHRAVDVIPVLAVIQERDAVIAVAQVRPALRADLEHRASLRVV